MQTTHEQILSPAEAADDGQLRQLSIPAVSSSGEVEQQSQPDFADTAGMPHWMNYKCLDGYFNGLKALVPLLNYTPEFPRGKGSGPWPPPETLTRFDIPDPRPFAPQEKSKRSRYRDRHYRPRPCYLDVGSKVPVPDPYAYDGVSQGQPEPVLGSYSLLGLRDDICWDRFGRYGPYGLGYGLDGGGLQEGLDTEQGGSQVVWSRTGKINYNSVDWGDAQARCLEANKDRFTDDANDHLSTAPPPPSPEDPAGKAHGRNKGRGGMNRTAVLVRSYVGFKWTRHAVLNFRAMVSELSLRSGGEYEVHFLLHVRDNDIPIWADADSSLRVLEENVPAEFHSLCTLWSESQMRFLYPGDFSPTVEDPSRTSVHGVYRSGHMPLQHFALEHPEFKYYWNWEMDMRWLGNYYELLDRVAVWARNQSRVGMWERGEKYYIPHLHGSWEHFTDRVHAEVRVAGHRPVLGPASFPGRRGLRAEEQGAGYLPISCMSRAADVTARCGVGEEADLITLNPIFDASDSGWVFAQDVTGYDPSYPTPPRRSVIVAAGRFSRRLLAAMHEETWRHHHSMFTEMFPASVALHHGLKAVYAPHPVYVDREWELEAVEAIFNGGRHGGTGGKGSPFDLVNEHNHKSTTWYYNSEFSGLLWRRWLGFAQPDGLEEGAKPSGGRAEEEAQEGMGRLCLRSMLVHPVKYERPDEQ